MAGKQNHKNDLKCPNMTYKFAIELKYAKEDLNIYNIVYSKYRDLFI